jgi:hypothetical protein
MIFILIIGGYNLVSFFQINYFESIINIQKIGITTRDFYRYECQDERKIGAKYRISTKPGSHSLKNEKFWYTCFDSAIKPLDNQCIILSFGIKSDLSFDKEFNNKFGCLVHSIDPKQENLILDAIVRNKSNSISFRVDEKWFYHKIGLAGDEILKTSQKNQITRLGKFDEIVYYLDLSNKVVDVLKINIGSGEWDAMNSLDMDYLCQYVKQLLIETHYDSRTILPGRFKHYMKILRRLEKCFLLFHRESRFLHYLQDGEINFFTNGLKATNYDLKEFNDDTDIFEFMITFGDSYFVNSNFL